MNALLAETKIDGLTLLRRGKVRDVYDLGDKLLIVSTDRLSAFDHILPNPIPEKGKMLTQASAWWFQKTESIVPNHLISTDFKTIQAAMPSGVKLGKDLDGRMMLTWKAKRIDAECVARGYLAGSGWKEYKRTGNVCGHALPAGLREASKLPKPIFTPATKADEGHDENISIEQLRKLVGTDTADKLEKLTLELYSHAAAYLDSRGVILADTKFEFGFKDGGIILIDEILTPDSSRLWPKDSWKPGSSPASFDKQFVRDHLETTGWDKASAPPSLPASVIEGTARRYQDYLQFLEKVS